MNNSTINTEFFIYNNSSTANYSLKKTLFEMPLDVLVYGSIFYPLIFMIGVTGNIFVIFVLKNEKKLRNFTNYLLANLSVADLMVLLTCTPSSIHDMYAKERWYLGKIPCYLISFIENCMGIASILSLFMITFERYYVICKPMNVKSLITKKYILLVIILIWIISIVINLPFIFLTEYKLAKFFDKTVGYKCVAILNNTLSLSYIIIMNVAIYFIIGIVLLLMLIKITKYLNKSTNLLVANGNLIKSDTRNSVMAMTSYKSNSSSFGSTYNRSSNKSKNIKSNNGNEINIIPKKTYLQIKRSISSDSHIDPPMPIHGSGNMNGKRIDNFAKYIKTRKQIIFMLMCVIIVFYTSLFPLKIWTLILIIFGHKPSFPRIINLRTFWYINITSRIFFYINSSINPILYNLLSRKFRQSFKNIFKPNSVRRYLSIKTVTNNTYSSILSYSTQLNKNSSEIIKRI